MASLGEQIDSMFMKEEEVILFAKELQSRKARKFIKRNGFPISLAYINLDKFYGERNDQEHLFLSSFRRSGSILYPIYTQKKEAINFYHLEGNYLLTEKNLGINFDEISKNYSREFADGLFHTMINIFERKELMVYESLVLHYDFYNIIHEFPVFNQKKICEFVVDLSKGNKITNASQFQKERFSDELNCFLNSR